MLAQEDEEESEHAIYYLSMLHSYEMRDTR